MTAYLKPYFLHVTNSNVKGVFSRDLFLKRHESRKYKNVKGKEIV